MNAFVFQTFPILSWNVRSFLSLELKCYVFKSIRNSLRVGSFYFSSSESYFLKNKRNINQGSFISCNTRKSYFLKPKEFFRGFRFLKYKKFSQSGYFLFLELGPKSAGLHFGKYNKRFLLRKYKNFFNIRARKVHFLKYKEFFSWWNFFSFWASA